MNPKRDGERWNCGKLKTRKRKVRRMYDKDRISCKFCAKILTLKREKIDKDYCSDLCRKCHDKYKEHVKQNEGWYE